MFFTEEFIFTYFDLASDVASKITILRVLRMARIVRLMQLLRKTRSLKELQKLVHRQNSDQKHDLDLQKGTKEGKSPYFRET